MVVTEILNSGGWMMYVILGVSIIALAITIDRVLMLFIRAKLNVTKFLGQIVRSVETNDYAKAIDDVKGFAFVSVGVDDGIAVG